MEPSQRAERSLAPAMQKWVPVIAEDRCTGCGLCVEACGPACLEMVDNIAVLVRPDQCGSEEHCIAPCRDDAIRMDWVPIDGNHWVGRWLHNTGTREKTVT
jgi:Na+-translocating ferredoxin:NAD+ oxidoreductase RNF subunit RnfB